ncbi:MAG TPA: nitroreductase family protein [Holophaga sp.]|nr:nitroreductase family protein [Holophaga sp.]
MNATLDVIERRKSVRAYEPRPIGREQRDAIIHAALRAPTAGNQMLYTILEIEDQAIKDRLAVTCDHQPFIAKAPLVMVFLADYQRWFDFFRASGVEDLCRRTGTPFRKPQPGDLMLAISDALVAAQTAVLAAESMGIGSCYIGDVMENYEVHRDLLKLPDFAFPIAMLCFGFPTEQQQQRTRPTRYPEDLVVFKNAYRRLGAEELAAMEAPQAAAAQGEGANTGQRMFLRKYASDFMLEMNRSVREALKPWEP